MTDGMSEGERICQEADSKRMNFDVVDKIYLALRKERITKKSELYSILRHVFLSCDIKLWDEIESLRIEWEKIRE